MKLNKCFSNAFSIPMKEAGFARKGILYYRLQGEIMQGVMLKTTNPFTICINLYPWWTHTLQRLNTNDLNRGDWTQRGLNIEGIYYKESNTEKNQEAMQGCLDLYLDHLLPKMDAIYDEDSYIEAMLHHTLEFSPEEKKARAAYARAQGCETFSGLLDGALPHNPYAILHKAVRDGSYEEVKAMATARLKEEEEALRRKNRNGLYARNPAIIAACQTDTAYRKSLEDKIQAYIEDGARYAPDAPREWLLQRAKEQYMPWEVKDMPEEDEWIRENLQKYLVHFFGGESLYAAMEANDLDTPLALYEIGVRRMRPLIRNQWGMEV